MSQQPYPMNRDQRRSHYREAKKDPISIYCPRCNHKTRHVAMPVSINYAKDHRVNIDDNGPRKTTKCNVVCVACGNILRADLELIPYEYVKEVRQKVEQPDVDQP